MKSGASDPFADDGADDEDEPDREATPDAEAGSAAHETAGGSPADAGDDAAMSGGSAVESEPGSDDDPASAEPASDESGVEDDGLAEEPDAADESADGEGSFSREELPYVLRRERVKDERPEVHQLFVQRATHEAAVEAERALEERLDADLSRTDAREAIYLAGMEHLDDAEAVLREWGYDL